MIIVAQQQLIYNNLHIDEEGQKLPSIFQLFNLSWIYNLFNQTDYQLHITWEATLYFCKIDYLLVWWYVTSVIIWPLSRNKKMLAAIEKYYDVTLIIQAAL